MARTKVKWFKSGKHTGWKKSQKPAYRRRLTLRAFRGNYLRAGRAKQALANVTRDPGTRRAARADALYFFRKQRARRRRR